MLDWGGVVQEIEIDTEHFDLHQSIPVDEDVRTTWGVGISLNGVLCRP